VAGCRAASRAWLAAYLAERIALEADLALLAKLGAPTPSQALVGINLRNAHDAVFATLDRHSRPVALNARHSFSKLADGWSLPARKWLSAKLNKPAPVSPDVPVKDTSALEAELGGLRNRWTEIDKDRREGPRPNPLQQDRLVARIRGIERELGIEPKHLGTPVVRVANMKVNKMDVRHFAKILVETGNQCGLDREDYHQALEKLATDAKRATESLPQAYTRIATTTDEGRLLFKAIGVAPPRQAAQDLPAPKRKPEPVGPASRELNELAAAMARQKGLSFEQSYERLWSSPDRAELVRRVKQEEAEQRAEVRRQRWPIAEAERENERDWRLGRTPGSARM
jgi:hypothetical protein